jgi:hypothetical protein
MTQRRIALLVLGLTLLFSVTQIGKASGDEDVSGDESVIGPGPTLILKAADYNAFSQVRPPAGAAGQRGIATAAFNVTYDGFSPEAEAAFQYAVDIWAGLIASPVTINVTAYWTQLPPGVLGAAATGAWANFPNAPIPYTWYPLPLAESLAGQNANGDDADIVAWFNSAYPSWYYGTDGNTPGGQFDLVTVVLHELGHGLGFAGSMAYDNGQGQCNGVPGIACWGDAQYGFPYIYDRFTQDFTGNYLINTNVYPNYSTQLAAAVTSDHNYFVGPDAIVANGGNRVRLYAPTTWDYGSSYSHLNEATFPAGDPNSLMTPQLGMAEAIHYPGQITLCLFQDMGWAAACNPEATWTGQGSTNNWSDPSNWSSGLVPNAFTDVTFDNSFTGITVIDPAFGGQVKSLTIDPGFPGTVDQAAPLTITGSFSQDDGTFNQTADLTVQGEFSQTGGTFSATAGTLFLTGDNQSLSIQAGSALNGLAIGDGTAATTVTLGNDLAISGDLTIGSGALLDLAGHELTVEGTVSNGGTLRQTKDVAASATTSFLHITDSTAAIDKYRGLDITPAAAMGDTMVEIMGNQSACSSQPADPLIGRCLDISPATPASATLRFWYTEAERAGQDASALVVWHFGGGWQQAGTNPSRSETGPECTSGPSCWVQVEQVSAYSPFVPGGSSATPTAIRLVQQNAEPAGPAGLVYLLTLALVPASLTLWFLARRLQVGWTD